MQPQDPALSRSAHRAECRKLDVLDLDQIGTMTQQRILHRVA